MRVFLLNILFSKVKFYEAIKPLNIQCNAVQSRIELYVLEVNEKEDEIARKAKVCL